MKLSLAAAEDNNECALVEERTLGFARPRVGHLPEVFMYGRAFLFVTLVILGAGLPYLLSDDETLATVKGWWSSAVGLAAAETKDTPKELDQRPSSFRLTSSPQPNAVLGSAESSFASPSSSCPTAPSPRKSYSTKRSKSDASLDQPSRLIS